METDIETITLTQGAANTEVEQVAVFNAASASTEPSSSVAVKCEPDIGEDPEWAKNISKQDVNLVQGTGNIVQEDIILTNQLGTDGQTEVLFTNEQVEDFGDAGKDEDADLPADENGGLSEEDDDNEDKPIRPCRRKAGKKLRPFQCHLCNERFRLESSLRRHVHTMHGKSNISYEDPIWFISS